MKTRSRAVAAALALIGCSGATSPGPRLSLSFSAQNPTATVAADALVITKAEIVLRKVELELLKSADCDGEQQGEGSSSGQGDDKGKAGAKAECQEFEAGPLRLVLSLTDVVTPVTVSPPPGTYEEAQFKIHKVGEGGTAEAAFSAANPDLVGKSIRVEGTFNGQPFVFESDLSVKQEMEFEPPLVVTGNTSTNITISVKLADWFKTSTGGLINPGTANKGGAREQLVKENIKHSFRAFEDKDRDGRDDD